MDPFDYAQLEDALDYLYDFLDQDLADRVRAEREYVPAGLEGDGGYSEAEVSQAFLWARTEWGMNTPPHVAWLKADGYEPPVID